MGARILAALVGLLLPLSVVTTSASAAEPDPERTTYQPSWHQVHFHMNAYPGAGSHAGCIGRLTDSDGSCKGYGESGLSAQSYPFENEVYWKWHDHAERCPEIPGRDTHHWWRELRLGSTNGSFLCGWVDRHWGTYRITNGQIMDGGHVREVAATTGIVADREHVQGGPLFMFLQHRGSGDYVLGLRGWLRY